MTTPQTLSDYIQQTSANWLDQGVPYAPFLVKTATTATQIWDATGNDGFVAFWQPDVPVDGFRPLGGICARDGNGPDTYGITMIKPMDGQESAVADPTGWAIPFTDAHSGNPRDLVAWYPIPPAGYVSLGLWFNGGDTPPTNAVYCVRQDLVVQLPSGDFWNDSGLGFSDDGHLGRATFSVNPDGTIAQNVPGKILFVPNVYVYGTFFDFGAGLFQSLPYGLLLSEINAPDTIAADPAIPVLNNPALSPTGSETAHGVQEVTVVPYLGIIDSALPTGRAKASPFYYVSCEPFYTLTLAFHAGLPSTETERLTTGITKEETDGFEKTTSVTVSATAGVEIGPASGSVSFEMTNALAISHSETNSYMVETELSIGVEIPANTSFERWRRTLGIQIYRADGTPLETSLNAVSANDVFDVAFPLGQKIRERDVEINVPGVRMRQDLARTA